MAEATTERLYTKKEAAAALRLSEISVHRALKNKQLGAYRFGARVKIGQSHLDEFLRRSERKAKEVA
jgi:excisionase family DNA binding protein